MQEKAWTFIILPLEPDRLCHASTFRRIKYNFSNLALVTSEAALTIGGKRFRQNHHLYTVGIHLNLQEEHQRYVLRAPLPGSGTTLSSKTSAPWKGSDKKSDLKEKRINQSKNMALSYSCILLEQLINQCHLTGIQFKINDSLKKKKKKIRSFSQQSKQQQ